MSTVRPSAFNLPTDLAIARTAPILHIREIAEKSGIREDELEYYGRYKAKVHLDILKRLASRTPGKYIDVTAITPTPLGEGKTVTTIGLSQGLAKIGKSVFTTLRQPSLGPVFGIKGGAAGGGYSQVIPMEDFNLHFTGDVHAVSAAHNLLAAFLDNHLHHGNRLDLDPHSILWPRVLDISDRALRHIIVGLGGKENGFPRESGFDISVASEVMAVLALSEDLADLRKRLGSIIPCFNRNKQPVTADDLKCAGAMAVLLREALMPNLIQTLEHTPCFVHTGPFANIAHGNSSIIADRIALRLAEYTVTESGFGADCGAEKFMDIKCRTGGLIPSCVVLVCSVRALKMHGGLARVVAGKPLDEELSKENLPALEMGAENLRKQIENILVFGVPVVVSINRFAADTDRELELIRSMAISAGAENAVPGEYWARGGEGARDLAMAVVEACEKPSEFRFLYPLEMPIREKIHAIGTKIYGADGIEYSPVAEKKIRMFTSLGFDSLPVCMAKTHLSLSHEPSWKGRPRNYTLPVRDVRLSAGAGFLTPLCGDMRTMPGLPSDPAGAHMDIDEEGNVEGLF